MRATPYQKGHMKKRLVEMGPLSVNMGMGGGGRGMSYDVPGRREGREKTYGEGVG